MRVFFVTSEVASVFKLGGLADVSRDLPLALSRLGVNVDIALPFYKAIRADQAKCLGPVAVDFDHNRETVFIFKQRLDKSQVNLILFRHPRLDEYQGGNIEEKFAFFAKSVAAFCHLSIHKPYDIIHCHDWHTALVPLLLGENNKLNQEKITLQSGSLKSVLTIHNVLYQGEIDSSIIEKLGVNKGLFHVLERKNSQVVNFLREGVEYADQITTVSPSYAKEILKHEFGGSLEGILSKRKSELIGILNGVDHKVWNPVNDKAINRQFNKVTVIFGKKHNKEFWQKKFGLPEVTLPLFGFVGRLEPRQKGVDLILGALKLLLPRTPLQVVILGKGDEQLAREVSALSQKHKKQLCFLNIFDEKLAHQLYAACDVVMVPSKFEPCGLTQMLAMRYGALPLVRSTGGLIDSVTQGETGFVFDQYQPAQLAQTIKRAVVLWQEKPQVWQEMVKRAMKKDFSWDKSARKYLALYHTLLEKS